MHYYETLLRIRKHGSTGSVCLRLAYCITEYKNAYTFLAHLMRSLYKIMQLRYNSSILLTSTHKKRNIPKLICSVVH